jgi:hypothetical protein
MSTRERHPHPEERAAVPATPTIDTATREAAERLLARTEDLISRALSQDSAAFLFAGRQTTGQ